MLNRDHNAALNIRDYALLDLINSLRLITESLERSALAIDPLGSLHTNGTVGWEQSEFTPGSIEYAQISGSSAEYSAQEMTSD
jgi:hypothetical protein